MDWLLEREPFHQNSKHIIEPCINGDAQGFLACHTILNLFYLLRKDYNVTERRDILQMLCGSFDVIGIDQEMLETALDDDNFMDIEDGTQIQCAVNEELDFIITRDSKGFENSAVEALSPETFLGRYKKGN
jgi:hypothetical protein